MTEYSALDFYDFKILSLNKLKKIIENDEEANNIYKILKNNVTPEINALGINTYYVPLPMLNLGYEIGFEHDYVREKYKQPNDKLYLSFVFYLDHKATKINKNKTQINIAFYPHMNKDNKIKIIDIFEKYLFGFFYWDGSNRRYPMIKYKKYDDAKHIDKTKLKDDDKHPLLFSEITGYDDFYKDEDDEKNENYHIIRNFMISMFKKYEATLEINTSDTLILSAYCFEDGEEIIQKLQEFFQSSDFIKKVTMTIEYGKINPSSKKFYWKYNNKRNNDDNEFI